MPGWLLLRLELDHWRRAGRHPCLWWRDDDAFAPNAQLDRLLAQAERSNVPLALSVIPGRLDRRLHALINRYPSVFVLQHGVDHVAAEAQTERSEFSLTGPVQGIAERLASGWAALSAFERRLPVYVPPWNRFGPNLAAALATTDLKAISAWGDFSRGGRVDAHVDLLRWKPRPRFAGRQRILWRLRQALRHRRKRALWMDPVGLLTHHLVHDEPAWRFLGDLFGFLSADRGVRWMDARSIFDPASGPGAAPIPD